MRWARGDRGNIEDLRGGGFRGMRGGVGLPIGIGGVVILLLSSWFTGTDFLSLLGGGGGISAPPTASVDEGGGPVASSARLVRRTDRYPVLTRSGQAPRGPGMQR